MAAIIQDIPERPAIIALMKERDCNQIPLVQDVHNYQELFRLFEDNIEGFNCIPDYLRSMLDIFPDQKLLDLRIYYAKSGVITDPQVVVAGVHTDIIIQSPVPATDLVPSVYILAGTTANRLIVRNNTFVGYLLISGGSRIDELVIEEGSSVRRVYISTCNQFNSGIVTLNCRGVDGVEYFTVEPAPEIPATTTVPIII